MMRKRKHSWEYTQ